jgi:hypothetical protein
LSEHLGTAGEPTLPAPWTRRELADRGFVGLVPFSTILHEDPVPRVGGVYVVIRDSLEPPAFLSESVGGHFKGRNPTVPVSELEANWVEATQVVYIGKANNLRDRLRAFAKYGLGQPVGHQGGRYIWQLVDHAELLVAWLATAEVPREAERELIGSFKASFGQRPFANLVD